MARGGSAGSGGPSRRTVLLGAVTAAIAVAGSRLLGLRDLDERALVANASRILAPLAPPVAAAPAAGVAPSVMAETGSPASSAAPAATVRPTPAAPAAPAAPVPAPASAPTGHVVLDWVSPLDRESARVAQLLRRVTFGASAAELEQAKSDGFAKTLDRLLETPPADPPTLAGADATPPTAVRVDALQRWWIDWMSTSPTPFAERMTLFWHGHFTSDYRKVGLQQPYLVWQNRAWRSMSLGKVRDMLLTVTADPAMLRYLDLGVSTGANPNENYSRELLELFTMGVDHFSEDDVRAGAKALAGWRMPPPGQKAGVFDPTRAYRGTVTFLGKTGQLDTPAVIDQILASDATAPYLVRKLLVQFVTVDPADATIARLAQRFRASRYDVRSLLRDVFAGPEFASADSYRALIKSPVELAVSTAKALEAGVQLSQLIQATSNGMGQTIFDPPTVAGWPTNESWISSNTMMSRANFVAQALTRVRPLPSAASAHTTQLDGILGPQTAQLLSVATDDRARWSVVLTSPEFQLK